MNLKILVQVSILTFLILNNEDLKCSVRILKYISIIKLIQLNINSNLYTTGIGLAKCRDVPPEKEDSENH